MEWLCYDYDTLLILHIDHCWIWYSRIRFKPVKVRLGEGSRLPASLEVRDSGLVECLVEKLLLIHIQTQQRWTLIQEASMEFMPPPALWSSLTTPKRFSDFP